MDLSLLHSSPGNARHALQLGTARTRMETKVDIGRSGELTLDGFGT